MKDDLDPATGNGRGFASNLEGSDSGSDGTGGANGLGGRNIRGGQEDQIAFGGAANTGDLVGGKDLVDGLKIEVVGDSGGDRGGDLDGHFALGPNEVAFTYLWGDRGGGFLDRGRAGWGGDGLLSPFVGGAWPED